MAAVAAGDDPIEVILADGGPSANPVLMQLQADTSGRRVETTPVSELSALGAAHAAGVGIGLWTLSDLEALAGDRAAYDPTSTEAQRQDRRAVWHAALTASRSIAPTPQSA